MTAQYAANANANKTAVFLPFSPHLLEVLPTPLATQKKDLRTCESGR